MFTTESNHRPVGYALHELANRLIERSAIRSRRRRFYRLLDLDDRMLDDIGVIRSEVVDAANLPLSANASTELHRVALGRRRAGN